MIAKLYDLMPEQGGFTLQTGIMENSSLHASLFFLKRGKNLY